MTLDGLMSNLNASQHAAVSSLADTLAILAGPGSGKTHTLTSRTAWLLAQGLQPWNIIVATFTVKAAREMKERIGKLVGNGLESKLVLGTFHSIARRYLARYGHLINIEKDFGIADSTDSLAIIKRIVKRHEFMIDPKVARSRISGRKARGHENTHLAARKPGGQSVEAQEFEKCFAEYELALQRSNLLDYDDLLLRCVDLLRKYPSCVSNVEAVLIDEFQDTNLVQFDLMRLLAAERKQITIVGDPDQSIYGFRAAETKNYGRMLLQYPDTVTIALEENYRSSGAILLTASSVIEQDSSRVEKSLMPTHTVGTRPVLRKLPNAHKEAEWIVTEIQRCRGMTGNLLDLNDFAILLRSASLSRLIESALGNAGISYRMVGGLRFYDRVEVKTILDYLRVINQPNNNDALSRIINTPSRRIGEVTIKGLLEEADQSNITLWSLILGVIQGKRMTKIKIGKQTDQGLSEFVNIILTARSKIVDPFRKASTVELIDLILKKTAYKEWLEKHHGDLNSGRWENVQELITQAGDFEDSISTGYDDESLPEVEGLKQNDESDPLSRFLANVALASEVKKDDDDGAPTAQVTISTIHAAKGLEWPVVFIPATYQGSIPHSRADDSNEERRLLYVAMTRAKALLYMSCPLKNSQGEQAILSPFLSQPSLAPLLNESGPSLRSSAIQIISQILRRPLPSAESISISSSSLKSIEDDLFPIGEEDENPEKESRWTPAMGNPSFTTGQQGPTHQRFEFGRSARVAEDGARTIWRGTCATTMERTSSFSSASVTLKSGFVTAGSHLQTLKKESVNEAIEITKKSDDIQLPSKPTAFVKKAAKSLEGQGTLFGFLGKADPQALKRKVVNSGEPERQKVLKTSSQALRIVNIDQSRANTSSTSVGISPLLANHRLGAGKTGSRLRQNVNMEQHARNDYVFLSSSPPKVKHPVCDPEEALESLPGLTSNPSLLRLIRPATTLHTTTISMAQNPHSPKRTLGLRRTMTGWSTQKGQSFIPPSVKRSKQ